MNRLFVLLLLGITTCLHAAPGLTQTEHLLLQLDSLIAQRNSLTAAKEKKIALLRTHLQDVRTPEERYWLNRSLYDEYAVYNADSAMNYVEENLRIAHRQQSCERVAEWNIKKAFLLAATGLLQEARDVLVRISTASLPDELLVEYYGQMIYLYAHFGQYTGNNDAIQQEYYRKEVSYRDSLNAVLTPKDPFYAWYKGQIAQKTDSADVAKELLRKEVAISALDTRRDAMNAYMLSVLYKLEGNNELQMQALIRSAIADVRTVNKDIASLEDLAKQLFAQGDIDRAYRYMNYCLQNALAYRNRVRIVGISTMQEAIHKVYQKRNAEQEARLQASLIAASLLSVILLIAIFYIYKQMRRLKSSRQQLNESNALLNQHVEELSEAHRKTAEANEQLKQLNEELKSTNSQLQESNYVKEEYIGYVFAICSNYISKLDEFRKNINRKAKAKQFDEIKTLTDTPSMAQTS